MVSMKTLKKLNAISGLAFAVFVVLHYICHYSLTLSGWDAANSNLKRFRVIYQNPVFEILLLLSVVVHGYANINLKFIRDKIAASADKKTDGTANADVSPNKVPGSLEYQGHRIAGYLVGVVLIGHVAATRIVPSFVLKDPSVYDYSFLANANATILPFNLFLVFQVIFAMAAGWHTLYGTWSAVNTLLGNSIVGKPVPIPLKVLALSSHLLIISAALAIAGVYYTVDKASKAEYFHQVHDAMSLF